MVVYRNNHGSVYDLNGAIVYGDLHQSLARQGYCEKPR